MATFAELAGATDAELAEARTAVSNYLVAKFPTISAVSGPIADLNLGPSTDALAAVEHRAALVESSLDPAVGLASGSYDADVMAAALAGLGVVRGVAAVATGTVALTFTTSTQQAVNTGARFHTADGTYYRTTSAVRFLSPGSTAVNATDVVLVQDPSNRYVGAVPVSAEDAGAAGNRVAGVTLTVDTTLLNLYSAVFATDATGGADAETDGELLARLPSATTARTAASFAGAEGTVRSAYAFSDVKVIGYGHVGMCRGRSVLTGQTPGRVDVRVRTATAPTRQRVSVTATYIGTYLGQTQWRFSLAIGTAPGWFVVERVTKVNASLTTGGYAPTVTPGYDLTGADPVPDVRSVQDAFLSEYCTASVTFVDPDTPVGSLVVNVSTKAYNASVRQIPGIVAAQTAVDEDSARAVGGDCLVRGATPVMVAVTAVARVPASVTLTTAELANAVARAINETSINSTLYGSVVGSNALLYLPSGTTLQLSGWSGTVYKGNGTTSSVSGTSDLAVSTDWVNGVGSDAVAFYCDDASVTATVTTL